jgi:hypothetical protein
MNYISRVTPVTFFHPFSTYPQLDKRSGLRVSSRFHLVRCLS